MYCGHMHGYEHIITDAAKRTLKVTLLEVLNYYSNQNVADKWHQF
jgi:hypothetical protein